MMAYWVNQLKRSDYWIAFYGNVLPPNPFHEALHKVTNERREALLEIAQLNEKNLGTPLNGSIMEQLRSYNK